jgi:hypothetical protein
MTEFAEPLSSYLRNVSDEVKRPLISRAAVLVQEQGRIRTRILDGWPAVRHALRFRNWRAAIQWEH